MSQRQEMGKPGAFQFQSAWGFGTAWRAKGLSLLLPATITAHLRLTLSPTVSSTKECQRLGQEICVGPFLLLAGQLSSDLHRC